MSVGLDVHARSVVACGLDGQTGGLTVLGMGIVLLVLSVAGTGIAVVLYHFQNPSPSTITVLTGHTSAVNSVVFSPNGHTLASGLKPARDLRALTRDLTDLRADIEHYRAELRELVDLGSSTTTESPGLEPV